MLLEEIQNKIPIDLYNILKQEINELRPCQEKAIKSGLLENKNLLVCTPTASGKTLIGEIALVKSIMENKGKSIYLSPLKALAQEKYKEFKEKYQGLIKIALSVSDTDSSENHLENYDLILCTYEKLDSLIRHKPIWLNYVETVVVDEIHLLNDVSRGPTLEIVLTILRSIKEKLQIIGLSATIGNPKELSGWLDAELILDDWRPVKLEKGIYCNGKIKFFN